MQQGTRVTTPLDFDCILQDHGLQVCVGGGVKIGGGFGDDSLSELGAGVAMVDGR